jgi:exodeoxyribonuclease VII small subunit
VTDKTLTFEEAEAELRTIVERLESGDVGIDEAIALWERGEALYEICRERLDRAEGKVEELAERVQAAKPSA